MATTFQTVAAAFLSAFAAMPAYAQSGGSQTLPGHAMVAWTCSR